jgi:hypothetical protein
MSVAKELGGLEGLFTRLDLRFRGRKVPLNPFDKTMTVFSSKPSQIVSEEFVEPEQKQGGQGRSDR